MSSTENAIQHRPISSLINDTLRILNDTTLSRQRTALSTVNLAPPPPSRSLSSTNSPILQTLASNQATQTVNSTLDTRCISTFTPHSSPLAVSAVSELTDKKRRLSPSSTSAVHVALRSAPLSRPRLLISKSSGALPRLSTAPALASSTASTTAVLTSSTSKSSLQPSNMAPLNFTPQTAADMLRQKILHTKPKPAEDDSSPINSGSNTPPGAQTPQPDPADKRMPQLTNYFTQQTPPQTPRALSHEGAATNTATRQDPTSARSKTTNSTNDAATVDKGQLHVTIVQGRGLRPSIAPYVVCIFQLSEDISGDALPSSQEGRMDPPRDESLARGVAARSLGHSSQSSQPMAVPGLRSRQSSQTNIAQMSLTQVDQQITDPKWMHNATFDVVGDRADLEISIYDKRNNEEFLGVVRFSPKLENFNNPQEGWYKLRARMGESESITGEVLLRLHYQHSARKVFGPSDFEILKLIGKGTFGQVFQVRKKDTRRIYAMKVLSKRVIVQKKEVQHTIGERNILVRTATSDSLFIVGLKFSFQTPADLYLVTDYMSGGELFWHLQREGRFAEDRAKFYIAELILALRHLHLHDIVYRDLKPENILLDANGHIALCDFGLSKANLSKNETTNTFCGTTEYLAPEVLLDESGYTKMVDFWSLGVLVFEMCCGWSPFYAEDTQQMYKNIAFGKVRFPRDALSTEGRNFVKGLLNRNPAHRLGARGDADELMAHPFFADVDWDALGRKALAPPFKPKLKGELDTSNFDPEFTNALGSDTSGSLNARAAAVASGIGGTPLSPTTQHAFRGFTFVDESNLARRVHGEMAQEAAAQRHHRGEALDEYDEYDGGDDHMRGVESNEPDGMMDDGMMDDI